MTKEFYRHILFESKGTEPDAKDKKRINDIITKSNGDLSKAEKLADSMGKKITDENKLQRRYNAAVEILGQDHIVTKTFASYLGAVTAEDENDVSVNDDSADFTTDISVDNYDTEISIPAENSKDEFIIENVESEEINSIEDAGRILTEISDMDPKTLDDVIDIIKNVERVSRYVKNTSEDLTNIDAIKNLDWISILNSAISKFNVDMPNSERIQEFMIVPLSEWREYDGAIPVERYPGMKSESYKLCILNNQFGADGEPIIRENEHDILTNEKLSPNIFVLYYKTKSWIVETFISKNILSNGKNNYGSFYKNSYNTKFYNTLIAHRSLETSNGRQVFYTGNYLIANSKESQNSRVDNYITSNGSVDIPFWIAISYIVFKTMKKKGLNVFNDLRAVQERIFREINVISYDCSKTVFDCLKTKYPEFPDFRPAQPKHLGKDFSYPGWMINSKVTSSGHGIAIAPMIYNADRITKKYIQAPKSPGGYTGQVINPNWNSKMLYPKYDKGLKLLETMIKKAIGTKKWKECSIINTDSKQGWKTILLPFTVL